MQMLIRQVATRWVLLLPARFQDGKLLYLFFFGMLFIALLWAYALISHYAYAKVSLYGMAVWLAVVLWMVNKGFSLNWGLHISTGLGVVVLFYGAWATGGIYSPRLAWLFFLPLMPFYVIKRRAGFFWLVVVLVLQLFMAVSSHMGWIGIFDKGMAQIPSSFMTYTMVTCVLIVVPLIYDHMYSEALDKSRQHQRELEAKQKQLEHTLQMREHFIATISHELRTPMNAILGFNALLRARVEGKPEALKVLDHTRQSADHLMTVINDILDYSQLQAGRLVIQPETFELRNTAGHAFELFWPHVKSMALNYQIELDEDLPVWVHTDRHRLMQVLVNLLGNAIKFTHQGSVVLRVQWEDPGVLFSVTDTGIGIAPQRQSQIFNRFNQADSDIQSRYGGNGLGLAISQKLVHLLGGDIGFQSEPGQGSRFWLRLPLTGVPAPVRKPDTIKPEVQTRDMAWRFLVVDDHPVNRLLAKQVLLSVWPHSDILEAADGEQALQCLRQNTVDLVLMDMVMPVMDGIVATRTLRDNFPSPAKDVPILGLTANVNPVDLDAFRQAGLSAVMLKPFEPAQLCTKVEQLLLDLKAAGVRPAADFTSRKSSPGS